MAGLEASNGQPEEASRLAECFASATRHWVCWPRLGQFREERLDLVQVGIKPRPDHNGVARSVHQHVATMVVERECDTRFRHPNAEVRSLAAQPVLAYLLCLVGHINPNSRRSGSASVRHRPSFAGCRSTALLPLPPFFWLYHLPSA